MRSDDNSANLCVSVCRARVCVMCVYERVCECVCAESAGRCRVAGAVLNRSDRSV